MTCRCIKKDGNRCTYKNKPNSEFCGVHAKCSNREASPARASPAGASPAGASPARASRRKSPKRRVSRRKSPKRRVSLRKSPTLTKTQKEAEKHLALLKKIRSKSEAERVREEKEKMLKHKQSTPRGNLALYQKGKLVSVIENLEMAKAIKWIDLNSNPAILFSYEKNNKKLHDVVRACAMEMFYFITHDLCNRLIAEEKIMPIAVACVVIASKIIGAHDIDYSDTLTHLSKVAKCNKSVIRDLEEDILRRTNWLGCKGTLDITRNYD